MTHEEAVKICRVAQWADGGCSSCVTGIMEDLVEAFPEMDWPRAFEEGHTDGGYWTRYDENGKVIE